MGNNEKTIVYLIGMGPGNADCLTREAVQALAHATVCIGAPRMLAIWKSLCEEDGRDVEQTFYNEYRGKEVAELIRSHEGETIAVLVSGDIGFYSGAKKLSAALCNENRTDAGQDGSIAQTSQAGCKYQIEYIPGLSSVIYLLDKLGETWEDAELISNHGVYANIPAKVRHHAKVGTLLGDENQVAAICRRLTEVGMEDIQVVIGERLSYPDEKVIKGYAKDLCAYTFDKLAVAIFINPYPVARRLAPGIKDGVFIRGNVPMTKEEVRMVAVSKLQATDYTPVIYDIGAGTGSVSIELALLTERGTVYAIEKNPEAVELLYANRAKFHAGNMEIVAGEATQVIPSLPAPTHVFIGGSSGNLLEIVNMIYAKNPNACIVVTAVTMETQKELLTISEVVKKHGKTFNMVQLAVTRSREVGAYHMLQAENPVWIATISS